MAQLWPPTAGVGLQIQLFVLHRAPYALHEDILQVATLAVYADSNFVTLRKPGEGFATELACPFDSSVQALVGFEYSRLSWCIGTPRVLFKTLHLDIPVELVL